MNWKKKLLALGLSLALTLSLTACGQKAAESEQPEEPAQTEEPAVEAPDGTEADTAHFRIAALKGPTAMGLVKLMKDNDETIGALLSSAKPYEGEVGNLYTFTLAGSADEVTPALIKGDLDMACVPANLAAVLYGKTGGAVEVLAVNTLGVLYIVENGETVQSMADLKGQTIVAAGKGSTPEYALRYLLTENGIDPDKDVTIDWKSEHSECVAALASGQAAIALLRSDNAGRATFLPLDTVQPGVFRGRLSGTARLASSLVQADARYDNIVSNLLGRIIVVEDINEASRVARDNGFRSRVVTMDGQVINAGGSFTGGSVQRSAGLFTRKQEMEELRIRAAKLQKDCLAAQGKTDQCKEQVDALQAELTATASEQITAANDRVRAEAEQKRLEAAAAQLETARNARRQEIDTLQAALADSRAKAEDAAKLQAELTAKIDRRTAEMSRIAEGDDSFLTRQNALAQDLSAKRLEQVTRQKDAELAYSQIAALEQRARDAAARRTSLEESVAALAARSDACRAEIADIRQTRADSQTTIAQKEAEIREATQKRLARQQAETETLARARTAADSREEMSREMARLAERKAAAESEYDQTVAKLWDEYQLSVSQAEALCVEFDSLPALRAQVADLRGKIRALGSVNVSAIEEYKEVKARYDALVTQVTDVEESRNELSRMISKLSAQMREIFTDSFRAINENFGRVFAELFGGGEASLMLEDESDVLSSGIGIRVAPPGKVIKNLEALSGGEQALVAISIYFAILAVNPAPFCILDEIEAALDDANVVRFAQYLRRVSDKTQFIVITHRRGTMEAANVLYGVTMQEDGVSKLLKLDLEQVDATLVS